MSLLANTIYDDPWAYFVQPTTSSTNYPQKPSKQKWSEYWREKVDEKILVNKSQRIWLQQLAQVGFQRFEFLRNDEQEDYMLENVRIQFNFSLFTFSMRLENSENFPHSAPKLECDFQANFNYKWIYKCMTLQQPQQTQSSSILQLITEYGDYVETMNDILEEIQSINSLEFQLLDGDNLMKLSYVKDDDGGDLNLLIVRIRLQPILQGDDEQEQMLDWILILYLDTDDILAYPNKILTEPIRLNVLQKLDPTKWLNNRRLYENLLNLFEDILNSS